MRVLVAMVLVAGCTTAEGDLVLKGVYRDEGDPCQKLGRWFSNDPNDDSPDIVACLGEVDLPGRVIPLGSEGGYRVAYVVPE